MTEVYFFIVFKILIGIVVGGVLGSFFGVLYHRLPLGESIITPRSYCDHCKEPLEPRDLIPIASYYLNKGECRFCHASISQRHVIIEAAFIVICVVFIFILFPTNLQIQAPINDFIHQR